MCDVDSSTETSVPANLSSVGPVAAGAPDSVSAGLWSTQGDFLGLKDSVLPREFRQNLYKQFARIEREFEREYRRIYTENIALQERLEKFEDGDHSESTTLAKKLGASMLSQRIKQQYKQSTSRLVSSLRQSSGLTTTGTAFFPSPVLTSPAATGVPNPAALPPTAPYPSSTLTGSLMSHGGSWQLIHQLSAHRDGIWEVTPYGKLLATASADNTVRLWANDTQLSCLLLYLGHGGSVNSVRFRPTDHLMLTSSGDGTAHLLRLPYDQLVKATSALTSGQSASSALEAASSSLAALVAGSAGMTMGSGAVFKSPNQEASDNTLNPAVHGSNEEGSPVRTSNPVNPIHVRHPHGIFQSANLGPTLPPIGASSISNTSMDSAPLSAADFLSGRDQLVTAGWDRLGRMYDLATGQEVNMLTGHDHQLTDVRCAPEGAPLVVTSSRDCTFRLWDFRQPGMRIHVQQAHAQTISTTQFLPVNPTKYLISAGADHLCRIWDLRQTRGPIVSIRTDAGINRFAISGPIVQTNTTPATTETESTTPGMPPTEPSVAAGDPTSDVSSSPPFNPSATMWPTSQHHILALPLNNRGIKFYDLNGNRLGRLTRSSSRSHSRIVTSVAWADEGACNFFSTGFDSRLLAWQIHMPSI